MSAVQSSKRGAQAFLRRVQGRIGRTARRAPQQPVSRGGATLHRALVGRYRLGAVITRDDGAVPLRWWVHAVNFGDLLSPWLVAKMTGHAVTLASRSEPHYIAVGSVAKHARPSSIVWGSGSFGTEGAAELCAEADYRAVRGPLTRSRLQHFGAKVPAVYGDPALLAPLYYFPKVEITHEVGMVLRWSERKRAASEFGEGVKAISLETDDIEGTIRQILSCRRIVTSSLHGLIIADAYGIPSAWVASGTPKGGEFKYFDYFATVDKFRRPQRFSYTSKAVTVERVLGSLTFDAAPIVFKYKALLDACPFLERV